MMPALRLVNGSFDRSDVELQIDLGRPAPSPVTGTVSCQCYAGAHQTSSSAHSGSSGICGSEPRPPKPAPPRAAPRVIAESVLTTPKSTTSEHAESLFGTQDAEEKAGNESVHVLGWMDVVVVPSSS